MPNLADNAAGFRMAVLVEGGLGIAAVAAAWLARVPLREQFPATIEAISPALARGVVATLPLVVALWCLVHAPWPAAQRLRTQAEQLVRDLFHGASWSQLALIAVLAGVGEELLFRGVLQTLLGRWTTPLVGWLLASVIFGLLHALSRLYFVLATFVGAYLGWLFWYFADVGAAIVAHALYDFIALVYLSRRPAPAD